jgi:GNAT superfamily N-acetyltransferase
MTSPTYRSATPSDLEALVEFQVAMALETEQLKLDRTTCTEGVHAVFREPSLGQYYVGESNGRVVCSTLITCEWSDWRAGVVWWIQSVYVIPEVRKQGVYAGLYAYIQNLARSDARVRGIRLYVDGRNTVAQQVYERLGMNGDHYTVFEWMK